MARKVSVACYLFTRLRQLGVNSVHGVPGDFILKALDHLKPAGVRWIGNCNELNAGYAADGYARVKGISALFTTFGVGEMSAYNAVAGSYAEYAPVVHIVGTPATRIQTAKAMVHHSLGDGNMKVFAQMFKNVAVAQADLMNSTEAPEQIDRVLIEAVLKSKPVYLSLPSDVVPKPVSAEPLDDLLDVPVPTSHQASMEKAVNLVVDRIASAQRPLILVDGLCYPFNISEEVNKLVKATGCPTMCFPFGKDVVDESLENFYGVYAGDYGRVDNTAYAKNADLVLLFGPLLSDNNSTGFSTVPDPTITITFEKEGITAFGGELTKVDLKMILQMVLEAIPKNVASKPSIGLHSPKEWSSNIPAIHPSDPITQDTFWVRLSSFLRAGDDILLANGTPLPGGRDLILPFGARIICSSIFLSVGHWLPAAQGVALAHEELATSAARRGRTILLEGDGSFQATAQELSTIIRYRLNVTIFLINNDGYGYERGIHGMDAEYNEIARWRYLEAPRFFGAPQDGSYKVETHQVRTWGHLMSLLEDPGFQDGQGLKMVEVIMDRVDVPGKIGRVLANAGKALDSEPANLGRGSRRAFGLITDRVKSRRGLAISGLGMPSKA